jgi:hypothetical protein
MILLQDYFRGQTHIEMGSERGGGIFEPGCDGEAGEDGYRPNRNGITFQGGEAREDARDDLVRPSWDEIAKP